MYFVLSNSTCVCISWNCSRKQKPTPPRRRQVLPPKHQNNPYFMANLRCLGLKTQRNRKNSYRKSSQKSTRTCIGKPQPLSVDQQFEFVSPFFWSKHFKKSWGKSPRIGRGTWPPAAIPQASCFRSAPIEARPGEEGVSGRFFNDFLRKMVG